MNITVENELLIRLFNFIGKSVMVVEFGFGFVMVGLNAMYLKRFWQLESYHKSFRQTFMGVNVILSFTALFHPLSEFADEFLTSAAAEYQLSAVQRALQYSLYIIDHVAIVFLHMKFYILSFERVFAFRRRTVYEHEDNNLPFRILMFASFVLLELVAKLIFYLNFDVSGTRDERILKALSIWKSPSFFMFSYALYFSSVAVGMIFFNNIGRVLRHYRYHSQSLSESFEIHQTEKISTIMWPVLKVCLYVGCVSTPSLIVCIHQVFFFNGSAAWQSAYAMCVRVGDCVIGRVEASTIIRLSGK
uniref:G protein-coupled receptor n=1 Tax=Bursaphelenchus xylophilus TaxID=6326 RepID=A0A1I7SB79_BURXY